MTDRTKPPSLPLAVLDHLRTVDEPQSPYTIGKAINRSAGAITVALGYLEKAGNVKLASAKPRRWVLVADAEPFVPRGARTAKKAAPAKKAAKKAAARTSRARVSA